MNALMASYAKGRTDIPLIEQTIGDFFADMAQRQGSRDALVSRHQGLRYSYAELHAATRQLASALLGLGFWSLVVGVAAFVGCVSMVSSNAMAVILDEFPHMAGTASSLAGTFRFGIGAIVGALLSRATFNSAWPMIWSIAFCASSSILFCLYASRPKKR